MDKYNPNIHHRRSIRLKGYDYTQAGLYFVTICCQNRECLYGQVKNNKMILNDAGKMVNEQWLAQQQQFSNIQLHKYIVMPNHFHGILEIVGATLVVAQNNGIAQTDVVANNNNNNNDFNEEKGQPQGIAPTGKTVGDMIGAFQSIVTVEYVRGVKNNDWQPFDGKLWQRNYWEHIIRNEQSYQRISEYIINNPSKWEEDTFYKS